MRHPLKRHLKHLSRGLLKGLLLAAGIFVVIIGVVTAIFILGWGFPRFKADFWPLDRSYVGPNLCASFVLTVAVIAHNEYRTALRAIEDHEHMRQMIEDLVKEVANPVQTAEEHVAADVAADEGVH